MMPQMPLNGSRKRGILGGLKVKTNRDIPHNATTASHSRVSVFVGAGKLRVIKWLRAKVRAEAAKNSPISTKRYPRPIEPV